MDCGILIDDVWNLIFVSMTDSSFIILKQTNRYFYGKVSKLNKTLTFDKKETYISPKFLKWGIHNNYIDDKIDIWGMYCNLKNYISPGRKLWNNTTHIFDNDKIIESLYETFYFALNIIILPFLEIGQHGTKFFTTITHSGDRDKDNEYWEKCRRDKIFVNLKKCRDKSFSQKTRCMTERISKILSFLIDNRKNQLVLKFIERGYYERDHVVPLVKLSKLTFDHNIARILSEYDSNDKPLFSKINTKYYGYCSYGDYLRYIMYMSKNYSLTDFKKNEVIQSIVEYGEIDDLRIIGLSWIG